MTANHAEHLVKIFETWLSDTAAMPDENVVTAVLQTVQARVQELRALSSMLLPQGVNLTRVEKALRATMFSRPYTGAEGGRTHQELQVLVPALRYLRGVMARHAVPWKSLREHLLSHAHGLSREGLHSEPNPHRLMSRYHCPRHSQVAAELLMALQLPPVPGVSSHETVGQWFQKMRNEASLAKTREKQALFKKLVELPGVQDSLSADELALLGQVLEYRQLVVRTVQLS